MNVGVDVAGRTKTVGAQADNLENLRVLVVEDMMLVAFDLADHLEDWGCRVVGPFPSIAKALPSAREAEIDCALLDINLAGHPCFSIASALRERGVPFAFLTGHDATFIPEEFRDAQRLDKPVRYEDIHQVVAELCCRSAKHDA
jgi:DNA-binding response OmpR family regulator